MRVGVKFKVVIHELRIPFLISAIQTQRMNPIFDSAVELKLGMFELEEQYVEIGANGVRQSSSCREISRLTKELFAAAPCSEHLEQIEQTH